MLVNSVVIVVFVKVIIIHSDLISILRHWVDFGTKLSVGSDWTQKIFDKSLFQLSNESCPVEMRWLEDELSAI